MTIRIPTWLCYGAAAGIGAMLLWQHTTHAEFLWFVAGIVAGVVGICALALAMQKRQAAMKQTAKEAGRKQ